MYLFIESNPHGKVSAYWSYDNPIPPEGFEDKSNDPESWDRYGSRAGLDFLRIREKITKLVFQEAGSKFENWSEVPDKNKKIYVKYVVVPYALRLKIISNKQDILNWQQVIFRTDGRKPEELEGRARVFHEMKLIVSDALRTELWKPNDYKLNLKYLQDFYSDTQLMADSYISTNSKDLINWILSEGDFTENGFASKHYYNNGLKDRLVEAYEGRYIFT